MSKEKLIAIRWIQAPESDKQDIEALGVKIKKFCQKDQRFENCRASFEVISSLQNLYDMQLWSGVMLYKPRKKTS